MEGQPVEQVENLRFVMRSPWTKNRSKYMCLHTIMEGGWKDGHYRADLIFILFYTPVPYGTVESSLKKWIRWGYIKEVSGSCYILGTKGIRFLQHIDTKASFIADSWRRDMVAWRDLSKDCCKTLDGLHWLPKADMIKILDDMKFHRIGTKRSGSRAGRPVSYPISTMSAPAAPQPIPAVSMPTPSPKLQQQSEAGFVFLPRCPQCHHSLEIGRTAWYCEICDCSYRNTATWEPIKGKI